MIRNYARIVFSSLKERKLRTLLTLLGIFIGIAAIISLVSLGQGMKDAIGVQLQALGTDTIIISGQSIAFGPPGQSVSAPITEADAERVDDIPGVEHIITRLIKAGEVEFNDNIHFTFVGSVPSNSEGRRALYELLRLEAAEGRLIKAGDRKKVVLGANHKNKELFGKVVRLGNRIKINGEDFEVVGFLKKIGAPQADEIVLMDENAMKDLYNIKDEVSAIIVQASPGVNPELVADRISRKLRQFRGVKEGSEDFTVQTSGQLLQTLDRILNIVTLVLVGIASIALLVGGIGIMNTMYTSVLQRTREIGIMKSIGGRNIDILGIFLLESGFLGITGGIIGIILGWTLSKLVELGAAQAFGPNLLQASFPPVLLFGALAFSFIVGVVSGVFPAIQAARLNPVDALRYE